MRKRLHALRRFSAANVDILVYGALRSTNYIVPLLCLICLGGEEYIWVEDLIARTSSLVPLFLLGLPTIVSLTYSSKGLPEWFNTYLLLGSTLLISLCGLQLLKLVDIPIYCLLALFLSRFFILGAKYKVMGKYLIGVALETTLYFVLAVVLAGGLFEVPLLGGLEDILFYILFLLTLGLFGKDIFRANHYRTLWERTKSLVDNVLSTGLWNLALSIVVVNLVLFLKTHVIELDDAEHDEIFLALRIGLPTILFYQFLYNRGYQEVYGTLGWFHVKVYLQTLIFSAIPCALMLATNKSMTPSIQWFELLGIQLFHLLWVALGLSENACQHLSKQRTVVLFGSLLIVALHSYSSLVELSFFQLLMATNTCIALSVFYVLYQVSKSLTS